MSEMIAAGYYKAHAAGGALGETKNGHPQVAVTFEIKQEGPFLGRVITYYKPLMESTVDYALEALRACGWTDSEGIENLNGVTRNDVTIVIKHSVWEGKTRAEVAFVNSLSKPKLATPLSSSKLTELKMLIKSRGAAAPAPAPGAAHNDNAEGTGLGKDVTPF